MRNLAILLTLGTALTAGACATSQENPFYKYSTSYQGAPQTVSQPQTSAPVTQSASYQVSPNYAEPHTVTVQDTAVSQTPQGYIPVSQVVWQQAPNASAAPVTSYQTYDPAPQIFDASTGREIEIYSAPANYEAAQTYTDTTAYVDTTAMVETGGQNGGEYGQNLSPYIPTMQTATMDYAAPAAPMRNTQYIPVAPAQAASTPAVSGYPQAASTFAATTLAYTVQEGDTVYGLSRRTCTTVDAIKSANGLPSTFLIKAGDTIQVPMSQC